MKCSICGADPVVRSICILCSQWALRVGTEKWPVSRLLWSLKANEQIREYLMDGHESNSSLYIYFDGRKTTHG